MEYAFRLHYGDDLRKSIEEYFAANHIEAGCIVSCVGCVCQITLRLADGITQKRFDGRYEIVSLCGTISKDGAHLHASFADEEGKCIGGHLCYGTLINTTAETVVMSLDHRYVFERKPDETTGYDELVIKEK